MIIHRISRRLVIYDFVDGYTYKYVYFYTCLCMYLHIYAYMYVYNQSMNIYDKYMNVYTYVYVYIGGIADSVRTFVSKDLAAELISNEFL